MSPQIPRRSEWRKTELAFSCDASSWPMQAEHGLCVPVTDFFLVCSWKVKRFHDGDGRTDITTAFLRIERAIGGKQHAVGTEECDATDGRRSRAGQRRVSIEVLEVVEWTFLEPLQNQRIILIGSARAQLIPAMRHPAFEIRNDAAEMMRDHLQGRKTIHNPREDQPRQGSAGLERPADHAANLIFRFALAAIVRHFPGADGMQQDRLARALDDLIDRQEGFLI